MRGRLKGPQCVAATAWQVLVTELESLGQGRTSLDDILVTLAEAHLGDVLPTTHTGRKLLLPLFSS